MEAKNILLVEGAGDQKFFNQLLSELNLESEIHPKIPRDVDAQIYRNGLAPLFAQLRLQIQKLVRGDIDKLGVIVDADHSAQPNNGFINRRNQLVTLLTEYQFTATTSLEQPEKGEVFESPDGARVGIWIMPNHTSDGMIEDLFISTITEQGQSLFEHASSNIDNLGELKLFADHHNAKAQLSTWLAWQKESGISPSYAYHKALFNKTHPEFIALQNWLQSVFN